MKVIQTNPNQIGYLYTMIWSILLTYSHYLCIIVLIAAVFAEQFFVQKTMTKSALNKLVVIDGIYGLSSIFVVTTGLLRVFFYAKGADYYFSNDIFILKFSLFILVGLLSIIPTVIFLQSRKKMKKEGLESIDLPRYRIIFWSVRLELILLLLIPLLAVLMANGVDL
jgi:putative membrane protein